MRVKNFARPLDRPLSSDSLLMGEYHPLGPNSTQEDVLLHLARGCRVSAKGGKSAPVGISE